MYRKSIRRISSNWHVPCQSKRTEVGLPNNTLVEHMVAGGELLLIKYGILAVFMAAMIEADVVPVLAGVVAHLGFFKVAPALMSATAGAFVGDYLWFCVGVHYSQSIQNSRLYRRSVPETLSRRLGPWQIPVSH